MFIDSIEHRLSVLKCVIVRKRRKMLRKKVSLVKKQPYLYIKIKEYLGEGLVCMKMCEVVYIHTHICRNE